MVNEEKLLLWMEKNAVDGFYVRKMANVRWVSGLTGADTGLFITREKRYILTDPRYTEQASIECPDYEIFNWRTPGRTMGDAIADLAGKHKAKTVAFESDEMVYDMYRNTSEALEKRGLAAELVPAAGVMEQMRQVKTAQEIEWQKAACEISCRALEKLLPEIRVGRTEKELAAKLSLNMVMEGADTMPYGNILISGARTSLLHGIPSEKSVEYGDFVLMDFGCQVHGYMSDMTRTVVVGKATEKQREVYDITKRMVESALSVTKAGVTGAQIYEASLLPLKDTPYFGYQYGNIGHGVGLFVHEGPFGSGRDMDRIPAGNVRTIEPGIYIPGWGGVRIEDQLLVTEDGYENMVRFTHDLIEL